MNTYIIPVTGSYGYNYDYYAYVHATTLREAYDKAKQIPEIFEYEHIVCEDKNAYEIFEDKLYIPKNFFHKSEKNDIMSLSFKKSKGYEYMAYFNVNWNEYTKELATIAMNENWSNETYPDDKILTNYMVHTYKKLSSERNITINNEKEYALFNTGLFTEFYQPIYAYHDKNGLQFLTDYDLGNMDISEKPPRANYFEDPSLLLFDWHYQININYKHILKDINNLDRIPEKLKDSKNILNNLNGSIETMKKKVSANYKLAIPQYYEGKIQLLLPLCLEDDETPSLALTVTKQGDHYQGHTCITLDMAYNNARLIAKPESNWLSQ